MADPAAVAETFLNCIDAVVTFGVTPDTWLATVTDGGVTQTGDVDEMTNNTSLGHYEDVATIDKHEADMTIAYKAGSPPTFLIKKIYPVTIDKTGGPYFGGNWRVVSIGTPLLNVKGGLKLPIKLVGQGVITHTRPS